MKYLHMVIIEKTYPRGYVVFFSLGLGGCVGVGGNFLWSILRWLRI